MRILISFFIVLICSFNVSAVKRASDGSHDGRPKKKHRPNYALDQMNINLMLQDINRLALYDINSDHDMVEEAETYIQSDNDNEDISM